jgi:hypothetical protein
MELQYISKVYLGPRNSPTPPAFGLIYEGAIGQPRETTSLCEILPETIQRQHILKDSYDNAGHHLAMKDSAGQCRTTPQEIASKKTADSVGQCGTTQDISSLCKVVQESVGQLRKSPYNARKCRTVSDNAGHHPAMQDSAGQCRTTQDIFSLCKIVQNSVM